MTSIGAVFTVRGMLAEILALWMSETAYLWHYRKAEKFFWKMFLLFPVMILQGYVILKLDAVNFELLVSILFLPVLAFYGKYAADIPLGVSSYLSVWSLMSFLAVCESWTYLRFRIFDGEYAGLQSSLAWAGITALVYLGIFISAEFWMHVYKSGKAGWRQLLSAFGLYTILVIQQFHFYNNLKYSPDRSLDFVILMSQVFVFQVIYLQSALFQKSRLQQEFDILNLLWHQKEEQYESAKENIALINRKCHDMKHQIAAMRAMDSGEQREKYYQELEKAIRVYDLNYKTGNDTLDTVLTDKGMLCETRSITMHCVADGKAMSFMDPVDIYTMIGNAMDNAVEAVEKFEEQHHRYVYVMIHKRQKFLIINMKNPVREQIVFKHGLPVTSKKDHDYHGYGVRSIRHIVHKYGGEMTVHADESIFYLRILIPVSEP